MLINSLNFRYMYRWGSSLCEVVPLLLFPWRLMWYALRFSHVSRSGLYFQWGTSWKSEEHVVVSQDGSLSAVFRGTAASAVSHFNVCPLSWVTIFRLGSCFHLHIPQPRLSKPKIVCRVRHLTLKWERERENVVLCFLWVNRAKTKVLVSCQEMPRWPSPTDVHRGSGWRSSPAWRTSLLQQQVITTLDSSKDRHCPFFFFNILELTTMSNTEAFRIINNTKLFTWYHNIFNSFWAAINNNCE